MMATDTAKTRSRRGECNLAGEHRHAPHASEFFRTTRLPNGTHVHHMPGHGSDDVAAPPPSASRKHNPHAQLFKTVRLPNGSLVHRFDASKEQTRPAKHPSELYDTVVGRLKLDRAFEADDLASTARFDFTGGRPNTKEKGSTTRYGVSKEPWATACLQQRLIGVLPELHPARETRRLAGSNLPHVGLKRAPRPATAPAPSLMDKPDLEADLAKIRATMPARPRQQPKFSSTDYVATNRRGAKATPVRNPMAKPLDEKPRFVLSKFRNTKPRIDSRRRKSLDVDDLLCLVRKEEAAIARREALSRQCADRTSTGQSRPGTSSAYSRPGTSSVPSRTATAAGTRPATSRPPTSRAQHSQSPNSRPPTSRPRTSRPPTSRPPSFRPVTSAGRPQQTNNSESRPASSLSERSEQEGSEGEEREMSPQSGVDHWTVEDDEECHFPEEMGGPFSPTEERVFAASLDDERFE